MRAEAGEFEPGQSVVCVLTGHGLKDPDTAVADAPPIVILPALPIGLSPEHSDFPGTLSLAPETLLARRPAEPWRAPHLRPAIAALLGGGLMGVGAVLASGCNISAFLAGIASRFGLRAWKGEEWYRKEFIPRISRAQSMDALSSQAAVAGYKAALLAANALDKFLPMLTTAAGTIRPAQVLVIGAGVAGLQAIATSRRLGAIVEAYDVRSATKEQIQSLGAKFVDTGVAAEGTGGYARELTTEEKARQQAILDRHIAKADAVISTAAIPGRAAPRIISKAAVGAMAPGAVIVAAAMVVVAAFGLAQSESSGMATDHT